MGRPTVKAVRPLNKLVMGTSIQSADGMKQPVLASFAAEKGSSGPYWDSELVISFY